MYDFLIVGAGLFGATFARLAADAGKSCLVIDRRTHIGGNCYTEKQFGIHVHKYGPHIFHCNNEEIWNFVKRFANFNDFRNCPIAMNNGKAYSLPFNMYTFNQMWGVVTPNDALDKINSQRLKLNREPRNLEEQALSLVGTDIYEKLIKGYTIKQWRKNPKELPASIIKRLPFRLTWNNNYFNDKYQGIPVDGYTAMFENILKGIDIKLEQDYFLNRNFWNSKARNIVFSGKIDEFYEFKFGELEYRTLEFHTELLNINNYQGNAVINYTEESIPWTRIIEHKHFETDFINNEKTIITKETPSIWSRNKTPYYPIRDIKNIAIFKSYNKLSKLEKNIIFGGRLSEYQYYDMHQVIASAFTKFKKQMARTSS